MPNSDITVVTIPDEQIVEKAARLLDYVATLIRLESKRAIAIPSDTPAGAWLSTAKKVGAIKTSQNFSSVLNLREPLFAVPRPEPQERLPELSEVLRREVNEELWNDPNRGLPSSILNRYLHDPTIKARGKWIEEQGEIRPKSDLHKYLERGSNSLQQNPDQWESVLGVVVFSWSDGNKSYRFPLVCIPVKVEEGNSGRFEVVHSSGAVPQLDLDPLPESISARLIRERSEMEKKLKELFEGDSISVEDLMSFGEELALKFSRKVPVHLSESPAKIGESPRISYSPILLFRKRSLAPRAKISEDIASKIREDGYVPLALQSLILGTDIPNEKNEQVREPLFSAPANDRQKEISKIADQAHGVVVQGPPGTGKSHTIANLIGDLASKGDRILVTSHTPKALEVLQEKLQTEIADLAVVDLDLGKRSNNKSTPKRAINTISSARHNWSVERLEEEIDRISKRRQKKLDRRDYLMSRLEEERENIEHGILSNKELDLEDTWTELSIIVNKGKDDYGWIKKLDPPRDTGAIPVSLEILSEVSRLQQQVIEMDIDHLVSLSNFDDPLPEEEVIDSCSRALLGKHKALRLNSELVALQEKESEFEKEFSLLRKLLGSEPGLSVEERDLVFLLEFMEFSKQAGIDGPLLSSKEYERKAGEIRKNKGELVKLISYLKDCLQRFTDWGMQDLPSAGIDWKSLSEIDPTGIHTFIDFVENDLAVDSFTSDQDIGVLELIPSAEYLVSIQNQTKASRNIKDVAMSRSWEMFRNASPDAAQNIEMQSDLISEVPKSNPWAWAFINNLNREDIVIEWSLLLSIANEFRSLSDDHFDQDTISLQSRAQKSIDIIHQELGITHAELNGLSKKPKGRKLRRMFPHLEDLRINGKKIGNPEGVFAAYKWCCGMRLRRSVDKMQNLLDMSPRCTYNTLLDELPWVNDLSSRLDFAQLPNHWARLSNYDNLDDTKTAISCYRTIQQAEEKKDKETLYAKALEDECQDLPPCPMKEKLLAVIESRDWTTYEQIRVSRAKARELIEASGAFPSLSSITPILQDKIRELIKDSGSRHHLRDWKKWCLSIEGGFMRYHQKFEVDDNTSNIWQKLITISENAKRNLNESEPILIDCWKSLKIDKIESAESVESVNEYKKSVEKIGSSESGFDRSSRLISEIKGSNPAIVRTVRELGDKDKKELLVLLSSPESESALDFISRKHPEQDPFGHHERRSNIDKLSEKIRKAEREYNECLDNLLSYKKHALVERLIEAYEEVEYSEWKRIVRDDISQGRKALTVQREVGRLLSLINKEWPELSAYILEKPELAQRVFQQMEEAWKWWVRSSWLSKQVDPVKSYEEVEEELNGIDEKVLEETKDLIDRRSKLHTINRVDKKAAQALSEYKRALDRLGKGTGKHAWRHRDEARNALERCADTLPIWVMTTRRVAEIMPMKAERFDVIIIDEASQSGLDSLFLSYLGKKLIVVGDEEQVSPTSWGVSKDRAAELQRDHLGDFELKGAYSPAESLYALASTAYSEDHVVLQEHFRSRPEIIEFSNKLCYEPNGKPLKPVRPKATDRDLQPIVLREMEPTPQEAKSGKWSTTEALALAEEIVRCDKDPKYKGKTFGVICMRKEQERKLQDIVHGKTRKVSSKRQLSIGSAADFQGDERDVIFISLGSPGKVRAQTTADQRRRFNVAVSRARDQVWLFSTGTQFSTMSDCVQRKLIEFMRNGDPDYEKSNPDSDVAPASLSKSRTSRFFDSKFEEDVCEILEERGYNVWPQYEANGRRIDLLVNDEKDTHLAVECDGDIYHSSPEDMERDRIRQKELEKAGYVFQRIWYSHFRADPDLALDPVFKKLEEMGMEKKSGR